MRPVIGFLLKTYPKLSETFILNEILELERQGIQLHIFSLRRPQESQVHPGVAQVKAPVTYIPSLLPQQNPEEESALLQAHLQLGQADPERYQQALAFYQSRSEEHRLNEFLQGGYLAWQLNQLGISHLHVHFANVPTATAEIAQAFSGLRYSITAHAKDIYLSDTAALDRRMAKAEFVLTCTDYNRRHLQALSTSSTPIHLAYHGLDLGRFCPRPRPAIASPEPLILSVGRFCEKKGFPDLLQACALLNQAQIPFRCGIVGYGPLEDQLRQQIHALGLDNRVSLLGKLTQTEVIEQYQRADLFVLPCLVTDDGDRDGIPNVLLEAMAMELPVVSTDVSGIAELVQPGHNGLLVPERNPQQLSEAIAQLLTQPEQRRSFGQAGRQSVLAQFGLSRNVGQVKDWLLQAVMQPSASRTLPASPSAQVLGQLLELATVS